MSARQRALDTAGVADPGPSGRVGRTMAGPAGTAAGAGPDPEATAIGRTEAAELFRALGDPTRLAIYELIRQGGQGGHTPGDLRQSVTEIASQVDVSLSTVSHHLKELRRAGLVRCERRGQTIYCTAASEAVDAIRRYLES